MLLKDERVSVCFSGEPRSLNYTHESIRKFLDNNFGNYDVFAYLPEGQTTDQLEQYFPEADILIKKDEYIDDTGIPTRHKFKTGKQRYLQQINGWKQSNMMRKEKESRDGFKYDYVVRSRMDVRYTKFDLDLDLKKGVLYIPDFHHFGGINDRFCFSDGETIDKYLNVIDLYHMNPKICTHAETWLLKCLKKQQATISLIDLRFNRIRQNGDECHWDSTDK